MRDPGKFWEHYREDNGDGVQCAGPGQPCIAHDRVHATEGDKYTFLVRSRFEGCDNYLEGEALLADNPNRSAITEPLPIPFTPRVCDLNKCKETGFAAIELPIEFYGLPEGTRATVIICQGHAKQLRDGAIAGFAWTPVFKHEVGL